MHGADRTARVSRRAICTAVLVGALLTAACGYFLELAGRAPARAAVPSTTAASSSAADPELVAEGRGLFLEGCASCHGDDALGREGVAPSLEGAGALSADFYIRTGRMPLDYPTQQPVRAEPRYPDAEIDALVAYVGSLGGPDVPSVDAAAGDLDRGLDLFTTNCAGCHQVVARGGIVTGAFAPALTESTSTQVAEAIRAGPYLMPQFSERQLSDADVDSIASYVEETKDPVDAGGWGIGNLGPIPEGMVAWFVAIAALLVVARLIGERAR